MSLYDIPIIAALGLSISRHLLLQGKAVPRRGWNCTKYYSTVPIVAWVISLACWGKGYSDGIPSVNPVSEWPFHLKFVLLFAVTRGITRARMESSLTPIESLGLVGIVKLLTYAVLGRVQQLHILRPIIFAIIHNQNTMILS
jgi:hypothetical protein